MNDSRVIYLDILRIVATYSVIVLHTSADVIHANSVPQWLAWQIANVFDSFSRFGVPIFFMISGALLLGGNGDLNYKKVLRKNVPRLLTAYIFWSMFYGMTRSDSLSSFWMNTFSHRYHLWFLPSLIGVYLVAPVLKLAVEKKEVFNYLLALTFAFAILAPTLQSIPEAKYVFGYFDRVSNRMWHYGVFYFLLGHWLDISVFNRKSLVLFALITISSGTAIAILTSSASLKAGHFIGTYYAYNHFFVALSAIAVFVLCKHIFSPASKLYSFIADKEQIIKTIVWMSNLTFGIYLMHVYILDAIFPLVSPMASANPSLIVAVIPLLSFIIFIIGLDVTALLKKAKFIARYIV